jgi:nucleoside 2-deoxyribosyltransferase
MADTKVIFVAFAIEDERQRDFLKGQSLNTKCPFEYVDLSVKEPYDSHWQERVRTRIRRSDGVISLVSRNMLNSSGEKWEIGCAKAEGKPLIGLWIYKDDHTTPTELSGCRIIPWTWQGIADFIDGL